MKIKRCTFPGGYSFKGFEGQPGTNILPSDIPSQIVIPLKQGFGQEVPALIKRGDVVKAGQIIARHDETVSSPVHASVNGTVEAIKRVDYFGEKVWCVFITPDGTTDWQTLAGHTAQWAALPKEKLEELLYCSGVTALGSSGIPTRYKSSIIAPADVQHLIVHHTDAELFHESLPLLLTGECLQHFVEGLQIMTAIMSNAHLHVAVGYPLTEWLFEIDARLNDDRVFYYTVPPKYPQQQDDVLISTLLKKTIPYHRIPADIGVLTLTVPDVLHVYEAVVQGKPLIERLVMLAGPGLSERPYLRVRTGVSVQHLIASRLKQDQTYRLILNSVMSGKTLPELTTPVTRDYRRLIAIVEKPAGDILAFMQPGWTSDSYTNTFAARFLPFLKKRLTTNLNGEKRGCISCGFCNECCPVGLYPNLLYRYAEREKFDEPPVQYGIFKCIDCNLCTYVCPTKVPVADLMRYGKQKLLEEGFRPSVSESFIDLPELDEYRGLP